MRILTFLVEWYVLLVGRPEEQALVVELMLRVAILKFQELMSMLKDDKEVWVSEMVI